MKKDVFFKIATFSTIVLIFVSMFLMQFFAGKGSRIYVEESYAIFLSFAGFISIGALSISSFFLGKKLFLVSLFISATNSALIMFCLFCLYISESSKFAFLFVPELVLLIFLLVNFSVASQSKNSFQKVEKEIGSIFSFLAVGSILLYLGIYFSAFALVFVISSVIFILCFFVLIEALVNSKNILKKKSTGQNQISSQKEQETP
jgi:hypothetical protein